MTYVASIAELNSRLESLVAMHEHLRSAAQKSQPRTAAAMRRERSVRVAGAGRQPDRIILDGRLFVAQMILSVLARKGYTGFILPAPADTALFQ